MDILNSLRILSLPKWVVVFLAFVIFFMPIFCLWVFYLGFANVKKTEVTVAALALIGSTLPILLASIVLFFSNSGVKSLRNKTDLVLNRYIPKALRLIPDNLQSINDTAHERATVYFNHTSGVFYSDYKINFIDQNKTTNKENKEVELIVRIELNVKRVNFNLYIPKQKVEEFAKTH
ncbi:MAG: hypothetical protein Q4C68_05350, partial [Moraxella sp.]|nr:hypothetical protein [Moraxella sp.]